MIIQHRTALALPEHYAIERRSRNLTLSERQTNYIVRVVSISSRVSSATRLCNRTLLPRMNACRHRGVLPLC